MLDEECKKLITSLILQPTRKEPYTYNQELINYKNRLHIESGGDLRKKILTQMHDSSLGGHSGQQHTYRRVKQTFY